ncbi:hypothetical protein METBIDRAFT_188459 [Metschnikowia bicuspidata var. bicuspidata NRRL YB-4993]|uniref:Uncharacterized protein n=1 Tax=Metschnikowia bicuspidata var. bicuspidata NRRL YB-4993 TaxID=869754 RepID=A0A1A0HCI4_9ASCO|nr:hypothetical protein METBIDRAFT_188459 [Metschnikowia bicuspidata var. bicuspidata NRRL YB-4993]OBA21597.1 hypothetical protein METBIDRAFT_188459 [Metschnikowia bicuspidata var. bicuspidata NRRL YB-4993]
MPYEAGTKNGWAAKTAMIGEGAFFFLPPHTPQGPARARPPAGAWASNREPGQQPRPSTQARYPGPVRIVLYLRGLAFAPVSLASLSRRATVQPAPLEPGQ